ncbi:oligomeric Golgi complex subunit 1, partial [Naviculisporaceae sp. PSN 640]
MTSYLPGKPSSASTTAASSTFPPDLSTLTTSSQIFSSTNYTLPQIRTLHKHIHGAIEDKAARLRTQVGGSYRELLGTADTIVQMKADMESVTSTLWGMGQRCGRGVVGGKVDGLGGFVSSEREGLGGQKLSREARVRLLGACVLQGGRVLKGVNGGELGLGKGDGLIVAAKICVLGRLLVKSLGGGSGSGEEKEIRRAERQLEGLRHRLLVRSGESMAAAATVKQQQGDVLKALCAYSLPTNSGAQDVLRHFLRVRSEAMVLSTETPEDGGRIDPRDTLYCLALYTKTLQDVQALFPNRLPEGLAALKKHRLLADDSLRAMEELRLDVYERWCGDEIRYFTPFIRHDDLDVKQAKEMWANWAKEGSEVFLRGLERTLEGMSEFKAIVELRTSVLKLWIVEGGKVRGFDSSIMLDKIRAVVNKHMLHVLEEKISKLRLVGREASAALNAWREGMTDQYSSLWEEGSFDMDLSSGAAQFTQDVVARLYGRNDAVSRAVKGYMSWFHIIDDVGQVVDQLKRQRWDNDVDEIEDEETIEERQKLLAKDDPSKLNEHLNTSLVRAFGDLDEYLVQLWGSRAEDDPNKGPISMYFLRLFRDIRSRLPDGLEEVKGFGLKAVPSLHRALTEAVVVSPLDELATVTLARRTVVGRSLWEEGTAGSMPDLPTSPSPGIFRFLRSLSVAMGDAGGDLWSPAAVGVLKAHLRTQLCGIWTEAFEGVTKGEAEPEAGESEVGDEKGVEEKEGDDDKAEADSEKELSTKTDGPTSEQQRKDLLVQWVFDLLYLGQFLDLDGDGELKRLQEKVYETSGLENSQARERLVKTSQEYWKRTSLLFGLL